MLKRNFFNCGILTIAILLLFFSGLTGCASKKASVKRKGEKLVQASSKSPPSWISRIPEEKDYYYFVGSSGDVKSFDDGKDEAIADALSQVVSNIGVRVTATSTYEEKYFAEQYVSEVSQKLKTEGAAKLQGAELKEIYYEKYQKRDGSTFYRVWILLKYSKAEIRKEQERLKAIMELKYGEVKKLEEEAERLYSNRDISGAIFMLIDACQASLKIEDGGVFFLRNMNRLQKIILNINLEKVGDGQLGYVGKSLPNPVGVKAIYSANGEKIPVYGLPIEIRYRVPREKLSGYKYLVFRIPTDKDGKAVVNIDEIYEVSDKNIITARVNIDGYLEKLKGVPEEYSDLLTSLKKVLKTKTVSISFRSDTEARKIKTGIFFIQYDVDSGLIAKPVTGPVIYEILYNKRFNIREYSINPVVAKGKTDYELFRILDRQSGEGIKRILIGEVKIINYDTISGFYTAKAEGRAVLYDRVSGKIIKRWSIVRSSTGSSREDARRNVLEEIGRSLGEVISNTAP